MPEFDLFTVKRYIAQEVLV